MVQLAKQPNVLSRASCERLAARVSGQGAGKSVRRMLSDEAALAHWDCELVPAALCAQVTGALSCTAPGLRARVACAVAGKRCATHERRSVFLTEITLSPRMRQTDDVEVQMERIKEPDRPLPNTYWVKPGRLLAGGYPGVGSSTETRTALRSLLLAGATLFLDLTEEGEYGVEPYAPVLHQEASLMGRSVEYRRIAVPDGDVPSIEEMVEILDTIDEALAAGRAVYLHCFAGVGRTATAVGCYLVRHGLEGQAALREVYRLRYGWRVWWKRPGPNLPQQAMVRHWSVGM